MVLKASSESVSFKYEIISGSLDGSGHPTGTVLGSIPTKTLSSTYSVNLFGRGYNYTNEPDFEVTFTSSNPIPNTFSPLTLFDGSSNKILTLSWSGNTNYFLGSDGNYYYLVLKTWQFNAGGGYFPTFSKLVLSQYDAGAGMSDNDYILTVDNSIYFTNNQTGTLSFNLTAEATLAANDKIYFKLTKESSSAANYTASFSTAGKLRNNLVSNISGDFVFAEGTNQNHLISSSISSNNDGNYDTIVLNSSLTGLENYQFVAEQGTGDNNVLYNKYGSVNEIYSPSIGDVVVIYWEGQNVELIIKNLSYDINNKRSIIFTTNLPSSLKTLLNSGPSALKGGVGTFLLLKKKPDETNILLKFNKKDGTTSLGFIIPNNLHPDVLANIDVITKEVKQKLIDLGTNSGGGTF